MVSVALHAWLILLLVSRPTAAVIFGVIQTNTSTGYYLAQFAPASGVHVPIGAFTLKPGYVLEQCVAIPAGVAHCLVLSPDQQTAFIVTLSLTDGSALDADQLPMDLQVGQGVALAHDATRNQTLLAAYAQLDSGQIQAQLYGFVPDTQPALAVLTTLRTSSTPSAMPPLSGMSVVVRADTGDSLLAIAVNDPTASWRTILWVVDLATANQLPDQPLADDLLAVNFFLVNASAGLGWAAAAAAAAGASADAVLVAFDTRSGQRTRTVGQYPVPQLSASTPLAERPLLVVSVVSQAGNATWVAVDSATGLATETPLEPVAVETILCLF